MTHAVEVTGLRQHYRTEHALRGVDLHVRTGEIYGLLGPNGAGKTTLLKTLVGLRRIESGTITLFGRPWQRSALARVGALIETPGLWPQLTGAEHLRVHARLRGIPAERAERALAAVQLTDVAGRRTGRYSLGMRWRLGIAIALLADPEILILDEPTNGLDPVGVRAMRQTLRELSARGTTVLISSHQLTEIAQLCHRVGVVVAGRIRYEGNIDGLAVDGNLEAGFFRLVEQGGAAPGAA